MVSPDESTDRALFYSMVLLALLAAPVVAGVRYAGLFLSHREPLYLVEYDWLVSRGQAACYSFVYAQKLETKCFSPNETGWVTEARGDQNVRFFLNVSDQSFGEKKTSISFVSQPTSWSENFSYVVSNGLGKGRVFHVYLYNNGELDHGWMVRLMPGEQRRFEEKASLSDGENDLELVLGVDELARDSLKVDVSYPRHAYDSVPWPLTLLFALVSLSVPFYFFSKRFGDAKLFPLLSLVFSVFAASLLSYLKVLSETSILGLVVLVWVLVFASEKKA